MNDELRFCRFRDPKGAIRLGIYDDGWVLSAIGDPFGHLEPYGDRFQLSEVFLLEPFFPQKVIGIGSNYRAHIKEMGRMPPPVPKMFLKPTSSVIGPNVAIEIPPETCRVDHEAELGVVIGRRASRISKEDAMSIVLGYTCVNDVTARDFQKKDGVFGRAKGFDTFCPIGPWVLRTQSTRPREIKCFVNGECRQIGNSSDMVFDVPTLVSFVSSVMTLNAGDIIATGTPSGVSGLVDGDRVVVEVEGIGRLENPVVNREDRLFSSENSENPL